MFKTRRFLLQVLFLGCFMAVVGSSQAQEKRVVQFSGVVMIKDSTEVVPGVHVYSPKTGRGTTTNPFGFFSLPVLEGDSMVFTAVGFDKVHYIIPTREDTSISLKVIVNLQEDIKFMNELEVYSLPTEEMFKRAVVTLVLPEDRDNANLQAWLQASYMKTGYDYFAINSSKTRYQNYEVQQFQNKFGPQQNNLLNPWAWSSFIRSLRAR